MKEFIRKALVGIIEFFAAAAVKISNTFNKGKPTENPAGKGTSNAARPRRRLVDGLDESKFTRFCAVLMLCFMSVVGAVIIAVAVNSGSREIAVEQSSDKSETVTIALGGCIAPSGSAIAAAESDGGYSFESGLSELAEAMTADISIAALSGQLDAYGDNAAVSGSDLNHNYPAELASAISGVGINYVFAANKYSLSNGYSGMTATIDTLRDSSLNVIGIAKNASDSFNCSVSMVNGVNVGVAGYNCVSSGDYDGLSDIQKSCVAQVEPDADAIAEAAGDDIARMRSLGAELVIICINWGNESDSSVSEFMTETAQMLADAGADIIVGYGPYTALRCDVLSTDDSGECYVFYSLGCLFADMTSQSFYTEAMSYSMTVTLTAEKDSDGEVSVSSAIYNPIYMADESVQGELVTVLSARYAVAQELPTVFADDAQWKKCQSAFRKICALAEESGGRLTLNELSSDSANTRV